MGRHFGDLAKIRHVITYSISPFEQRAFPNYFSKGIPNVWRRFKSSVFKVAPRKSFWDKIKRCTGFFFFFKVTKLLYKPASLFTAMILMYLTYTWGNHVHEQSKRKNPADYENDQWNRPAEEVSLCNFLFLYNSSIKKIFMGKNAFLTCCCLITLIQFSVGEFYS